MKAVKLENYIIIRDKEGTSFAKELTEKFDKKGKKYTIEYKKYVITISLEAKMCGKGNSNDK